MDTSKAIYAVVKCYSHGRQGITQAEYNAEMERANHGWSCPVCNQPAMWSDPAWEVLEAARFGDELDPDDVGPYAEKEVNAIVEEATEALKGRVG